MFQLKSQPTTDSIFFKKTLTLKIQAREAATDNLGNVYVITLKNFIEKYSPEGALLARFSENRYGHASGLDLSNPLKIMVLYPDFRQVVFLDRTLNRIGELNLDAAGTPFARCPTVALDGNVWLFDEATFQLKKIATSGEAMLESQALNLLLPGDLPKPTAIREVDGLVFLNDSARGVFVFDAYAQFSKQLTIKGMRGFQVFENSVFYCAEGFLKIENLQNFQQFQAPLPADIAQTKKPCRVFRARLLAWDAETLEVYSF